MTQKRKPNRSLSPLLGVPARGVIPSRVSRSMYPRCYGLGLRMVSVGGNTLEGFDIEGVQKALPGDGFEQLKNYLADKSVFVCGHRTDEDGYEVHCVYARDLEAFLQGRRPLLAARKGS